MSLYFRTNIDKQTDTHKQTNKKIHFIDCTYRRHPSQHTTNDEDQLIATQELELQNTSNPNIANYNGISLVNQTHLDY